MRSRLLALFIFSFLLSSAQKTDKLTVHFKFNDFTLDATYKSKIDSAIQNQVVKEIQITAHCDSIGNNDYNDALSLKRAIAVKEYLVSNNIDSALININSKGKRFPLNKNETEEARALNRRAEIIFTILNKEPVVEKTEIPKDTIIKSAEIKPPPPPEHHPDVKTRNIEELNMDSVEVGSKFTLSNLNFMGGRHDLLDRSEETLKLLLSIMKNNPTLKIEIDGYVCCVPDDKDGYDWGTGTYDLSMNRAKVIYLFLVKNGIDKNRLYYTGFGGSHKLNNERTEEERTANRRVEIKILKK